MKFEKGKFKFDRFETAILRGVAGEFYGGGVKAAKALDLTQAKFSRIVNGEAVTKDTFLKLLPLFALAKSDVSESRRTEWEAYAKLFTIDAATEQVDKLPDSITGKKSN